MSSSKKPRPAAEEVVEDEDTNLDEEDKDAVDEDDDDENSKDSEWEKDNDIAPIEGETREERTKCRTSQKDASTLRSDRLKAEGSEAASILSSSRKLAKSNPVPLYQPWSRRHAIASHALKDAFRGINLIRNHTWQWATTSSNSWVRGSRILAGSAIVKHCVIMDYRRKLINDTNGGLCFLRNKIEAITERYRVVIKKGPRQTTLFSKQPASAATSIPSSSTPIPLEWADQLIAPPSAIEDFDLDDEVANHGREVTQARQCNELQRAITMLEGIPIFWQDTTGSATKVDRPSINPQIQSVFEQLVKVFFHTSSSECCTNDPCVYFCCRSMETSTPTSNALARVHAISTSPSLSPMASASTLNTVARPISLLRRRSLCHRGSLFYLPRRRKSFWLESTNRMRMLNNRVSSIISDM